MKKDIIVSKSELALSALKAWGYSSPILGVAALNPHGGEGGLIGQEEIEEIGPALLTIERGARMSEAPFLRILFLIELSRVSLMQCWRFITTKGISRLK